ncbi:hypothetical protein V1506DRAFT_536839 [Lipomyces tetrasporus]
MSATSTGPSLTVSPTASAVSSAPATSSSSSSGGATISPSTSPLLFFVALGFGIVFTNLWIIVGVKYCFRRNRRLRARALAANGEIPFDGYDETGYDMGFMRPPLRRRREKKLMTTDEMDERFPVKKYKVWRCERESAGLSTEGGVASQIPSRAPSMREVDLEVGAAMKEAGDRLEVVDSTASSSEAADHSRKSIAEHEEYAHASTPPPETSDLRKTNSETTAETLKPHADEDEDDDEVRLHPNLHPDLADTSGDACAICLESLEDEDDVRGLTCGHAFHAACIDPWLTTRRACCPLCKADYYVPKQLPQPQPAHQLPEGHAGGVLPDQYAFRHGGRPIFFRSHGLTGFPVVHHHEEGDGLPAPATSSNRSERSSTRGHTWASRFVRARLPRSRRREEETAPVEQVVVEPEPQEQQAETEPSSDERVELERQEEERRRQEAEYRQNRDRSYDMNVNFGIHGAVI